jgi:hypothetical protein
MNIDNSDNRNGRPQGNSKIPSHKSEMNSYGGNDGESEEFRYVIDAMFEDYSTSGGSLRDKGPERDGKVTTTNKSSSTRRSTSVTAQRNPEVSKLLYQRKGDICFCLFPR